MADGIFTAAGTRVYIGTTAAAPNLAAFEADTWTEVKIVEDAGDLGDEYADVSFTGLSDSRVRHLKGAADGGSVSIIMARDPSDAGQIKVAAALGSKADFNWRFVLPDTDDGTDGSEFYFRGPVRSFKNSIGKEDNVLRRTAMVGVNTAIIEVLP